MDEQLSLQQARTDRALIARMQRNDADAIEAFFNAYYPLFRNVALRQTNDYAAAEDVAQDAVLRIIERVGLYNPEAYNPRAWFMAILNNLLRDRFRRAWVRRAESLNDDAGGAPLDPPDREPSAQDRAEARELNGVLSAALMMLHPGDRELIVMRDYDGLRAADMAAALGVSAEQVGGRLHRARRRLAELLETHWPDLFPSRGR